jgi:hypothetical protein
MSMSLNYLSFFTYIYRWRNFSIADGNIKRPSFLHCLPIGMENRQYKVGSKPEAYANAIEKFIINSPNPTNIQVYKTMKQYDSRPLLMIAFWPKSRVSTSTIHICFVLFCFVFSCSLHSIIIFLFHFLLRVYQFLHAYILY